MHEFPSSTAGAVPARQVPAWHVSEPLQRLLSAHEAPFARATCFTPSTGSQESAVQGLPSSTDWGVLGVHAPLALHCSTPLQAFESAQLLPAGTGVCVTPLAGVQASVVHGLPSSTSRGEPALQKPIAVHVSCPLQRSLSSQAVPGLTGVCETPPEGSQVSAVHGLPSSVATVVPAWQRPAVQASPVVQLFASLHALPSLFTGLEQVPEAASQLPAR